MKSKTAKIKRTLPSPEYLSDYKSLKETRKKINKKTQEKCYICEKKFKDDDLVGIVFLEMDFNKIAHRECCKKYQELES